MTLFRTPLGKEHPLLRMVVGARRFPGLKARLNLKGQAADQKPALKSLRIQRSPPKILHLAIMHSLLATTPKNRGEYLGRMTATLQTPIMRQKSK